MPDNNASSSTATPSTQASTSVEYVVDTQMKRAVSTIKSVAQSLYDNPMYSMYIDFAINGVHINTTSTQPYNNIAMSLVNRKNGSGEANTFTLVIAYCPSLSSSFDVNAFERALSLSSSDYSSPDCLKCTLQYGYANHPELRTQKYEGLLLNYECDLQDGMLIYTLTGYSGLSKLTERKKAISIAEIAESQEPADGTQDTGNPNGGSDQNSGNSSPSSGTGSTSGSSGTGSSGTGSSGTGSSGTGSSGTGSSSTSGDGNSSTGSNGGESDSESEDDEPVTAAATAIQLQPTVAAEYIVQHYMEDYECHFGTIRGESVLGSDEAVVLNTQLDKNPMKALTDILNKAIHSSQKEVLDGTISISDDRKITYGWTVSDCVSDSAKPSIYIYAFDPAEEHSSSLSNSITFNWGHAGADALSNFVISFKPKFEGSVIMSLWGEYVQSQNKQDDKNKQESQEQTKDDQTQDATTDENAGTDKMDDSKSGSIFINEKGKLEVAASTAAPAAGGDVRTVNANIEQNRATWITAVQYPYSADMTTLGVPCEIPKTGLIEVNALVGYGENIGLRKHHSSGTYMVISTEDVINESGFTTNWSLRKLDKSASELKGNSENISLESPAQTPDSDNSSGASSSTSSSSTSSNSSDTGNGGIDWSKIWNTLTGKKDK